MSVKVVDLKHPQYSQASLLWRKWRLAYEGGDMFKRSYLKKYSKREDENDFAERMSMSYIPAFAKSGINEIRDSIYRRMYDITRQTTSETYNTAIEGKNGGVDRKNSSMNYFLGINALPELLVMSKVGIYVDMPNVVPSNLREAKQLKPYMYVYKVEQIKSWSEDEYGDWQTLLLQDIDYNCDNEYGLPDGNIERYRYYWKDESGVYCQFFDSDSNKVGEPIKLGINKIPFILLELSNSLIEDICDYQIALLNMASSDVAFARLSNYPLYVEEYDAVSELSQNLINGSNADETTSTDGSSTKTEKANDLSVKTGLTKGRRIAKGLKYPDYVAPPSDCLKASMEKQQQMKEEIKELLKLSLGNLKPTRSSADSKQADISREENGLSFIGLELELAERKIVELWLAYENNNKPYDIKYPLNYDIKSIETRINEANGLAKLVEKAPSTKYKKEISKLIAKTLLSNRIPFDQLSKIYAEIDSVETIIDHEQLIKDLEAGIVSKDHASKIRLYPAGEAEKANKEHAERATIIAMAQSKVKPNNDTDNAGARGVDDLSADKKADVKNDRNKSGPYKHRGEGKDGRNSDNE